MIIKAYDIAEKVTEIELTDEKTDNINKIFTQILGENEKKREHLSVKCCLINEHQNNSYVLYDYMQNENNFDYTKFANCLLDSEKTVKGIRSKTIQEGFLFIKKYNKTLYLMKLEKISDVDSESFEMKAALGTDQNYYKLCIFKSYDDIIIVDKNTRLASYWFEKFLGLNRKKDSDINTEEIIDLIDNKKLFNHDVITSGKLFDVYDFTIGYICQNPVFDKVELINKLIKENLINDNELNNVFTKDASSIDFEFDISPRKIKQRFHKSFKVSEYTEVKTDNYVKLKKRQEIRIEDNRLILTISGEYLETVKKELGYGNK